MRTIAIVVAVSIWSAPGFGQTAADGTTAAKKAPSKGIQAKSPPAKSAKQTGAKPAPAKSSANSKTAVAASKGNVSATVAKTATRTAASQKSTARRTPAPRYHAQEQPTPARYREIQQALADRGYFQGAPDGVWGTESVEALKRFQTDQNLDADGKVGALSLIALGLGPKREKSAAPASAGTPISPAALEPSPEPVHGQSPDAPAVP